MPEPVQVLSPEHLAVKPPRTVYQDVAPAFLFGLKPSRVRTLFSENRLLIKIRLGDDLLKRTSYFDDATASAAGTSAVTGFKNGIKARRRTPTCSI